MTETIEINTDKETLDIEFITAFISNTYWAKDRSVATMKTCIENSLNFGVYLNKKQIGYARVVTDYAQFAYLMDLFIDQNYRGKGYSKDLLKNILDCKELKNVKSWRLATTDAHKLYEKFGFGSLENPQNMMELRIKK